MSQAHVDRGTETQRVWDEFHARLLSFIRRRVESDADAEDVLMDVFASVHAHAQGLRDKDRISSWIHRIARNSIADHHRSRARVRSAVDGLSHNARAEGSDLARPHQDQEDESAARADLSRCIEPLLARLPEEYGQALKLTELEGETQKAAAEKLGLSVSGMKSRVQRGRRKLKEALTDCCRVHLDVRRAVTGFEPQRSNTEGTGCCASD